MRKFITTFLATLILFGGFALIASPQPAHAIDFYGPYLIHNGSSTGRCMDVEGASQANGARIILWDCDRNKANQLFIFRTTSIPYVYRIIPNHSLKFLDISGASLWNGAQLIQYDYVGPAYEQEFKVEGYPIGSGGIIIKPTHNPGYDKCLTRNGSPINGTPVVQWSCVADSPQAWYLEYIQP